MVINKWLKPTVKKTFLFFMIFFTTTLLVSANFSVSLELSGIHYIKKNNVVTPTIFLKESFELKVVVSGKSQAPNLTSIKGIENFMIRGETSHSNVSITNSGMLVEQTTGYTLFPKEIGTFQIGPVTLTQNGQTISSNTVTIAVEKQTQPLKLQLVPKKQTARGTPTNKALPPDESTTEQSELYATMRADKDSVFTEEPIVVTISIHQRGNKTSIRGMQAPNFPDCTVKEIEKVKQFQERVGKKTYTVLEKTYLIFPNKPGRLVISPAQIIYNVREQRRTRHSSFFGNDLFSNFFNTDVKQKVTPSNPVAIEVKKIPPHTDMQGNALKVDGIGNFSLFSATVDKTNVVLNEPIKLTLTISGNANFDLILPLKPNLPKNFKSYDSKTNSKQTIENNMLEGTKTFEFIVQIPQAGTWSIPAQIFTHFDTKSQTYKTLKSQPIPITVTIPEGASDLQQQITPDQKETKQITTPVLSTDIHFIQEDGPVSERKTKQMSFLLFFLLVLLVPSFFYFERISGFVAPFILKMIPTSIKSTRRRKKILPVYQKQITNLVAQSQITVDDPQQDESNRLASGHLEKSYQIFIHFFAELANTQPASVTETWIEKFLEKNNFSSEKIDSFIQFLHECAQHSFTAQAITKTDLQNFEQKANYWLVFIHQTLEGSG